MRIAVPKEVAAGETRVAVVPETAARLVRSGAEVVVEPGAGAAAGFADDAYVAAGARLEPDLRALWTTADLVLKVQPPREHPGLGLHEADVARQGSLLVALGITRDPALIERLAAREVTAFSLERIPRTTRAQRMDVLSSMATVAGYRAVLIGAAALGKFFPLLMTAAGTIAPARVFVLGAGVAGLQAIATARRLGAVVEAFDVRPAVREEVQSLGATFVQAELASEAMTDAGGYAKAMSDEHEARERTLLAKHVAQSDVVITTANVPGRKAPVLITEDMLKAMRPGSVVVDLAAESGGNCERTRPGEDVTVHGVRVLGPLNLPAALPEHASQMYSRNLAAFVALLIKDGALAPDFADDIVAACAVTRGGRAVVEGAS